MRKHIGQLPWSDPPPPFGTPDHNALFLSSSFELNGFQGAQRAENPVERFVRQYLFLPKVNNSNQAGNCQENQQKPRKRKRPMLRAFPDSNNTIPTPTARASSPPVVNCVAKYSHDYKRGGRSQENDFQRHTIMLPPAWLCAIPEYL